MRILASAKNYSRLARLWRKTYGYVYENKWSALKLSTSPLASIDTHVHHHEELLTHSYCQGDSHKTLIGETIGERLDQITERYPDREAVVFTSDGRRATFADFREEIDNFAAGLLAMGLKKGDRIGMWGPNCMEWVLTQYATARTGMIMVNINPAYRPSELQYALKKVGCSAIVSLPTFKTQNYYQMLSEVVPELANSTAGQLNSSSLPDLKFVIMSEGEAKPGTFTLQDVVNFGGVAEKQKVTQMQSELQFDDPINIQFTSGTTGSPKGATLTHHGIMNNGYFTGVNLDYQQENTKVCIPVPLYHCFGMVVGSLSSMIHGATAVYPGRGFDPLECLKAIQNERCTSIYGTPTMFIDMLYHSEFDKFDMTSLRTGVMAGSPCPIEIMKQVIKKMHCSEMTICYGLTETSPATNQTLRNDHVDLRVSTVGKPLALMETKVINEENQIVPVGEPGEICFRGHGIMLGYWNDKEKTDEAIDEYGWFHSGDLAVMDENKYCKILGRSKDMIIRGGENIYPTEIEQFLYKHPKIEDVQVIGVPDERLGEEVCAWIKLKKDVTASPDEIKDFCKEKISYFKIPKLIKFVDEFPLTVTGKVKKFEMRQKMAAEVKT